MRCFENHYVVSLDEIKESDEKIPIHKPIYCNTHKKVVQFFCSTCEVPQFFLTLILCAIYHNFIHLVSFSVRRKPYVWTVLILTINHPYTCMTK